MVYIVNDRVRIQDVRNPNIFRSSLTYFVCRKYARPGTDPRNNPEFWDKDGCGKKLHQCKKRFARRSSQKIFLETEVYEQQMWNIQGYEENVHQGYLKLKNNYTDLAEYTKSLFKYNKNGWGYRHLDNQTVNYNSTLYENAFPETRSSSIDCVATRDSEWRSANVSDLFKEFTFMLDIEYLGDPQRYDFYPQAEEEELRQEDVDQIIFKTSKENVGYSTNHSQFVLGLQKEPYIEFKTHAPYGDESDCAEKTHRIKLVGVNEEGDYFRVQNRNGLPTLPQGGYDVKNSKNFVLTLRKDKYSADGTANSRARIRANWSCLTYPNDEEKESVFIESQSTFYIKNMITTDTDRFVFFGGTTKMPVVDASGLLPTDINKFTDEPTRYENKWSQQDIQVASMGFWTESLSNGQINKLKTEQNTTEEGTTYAVELIKTWDEIVKEDEAANGDLLKACNHFWQEPFAQDGNFYVKDHKNGSDLMYKDSNYPFGGGEKTQPYTKAGYDFLDLQFLVTRTPNVGKETLVEGEFGTLPFGGFPGTDGYRFQG